METNLAALGVQPVEAPTQLNPLPGQRRIPFNDNLLFPGSHMPTKTAPKSKATTKPQQTDDELLAWALGCKSLDDAPSSRALASMQQTGATNAELYAEIVIEFLTINPGSPRPYAVEADEDHIRMWFDATTPTGEPDLQSKGEFGKFAGKLLSTARALLGIGEPKKTKPQEPDDDVLARSLSYDDGKFANLRQTGASDEQVLVAVRERWRKATVNGGPGKRHYDVVVNDARWGTAIWFDDGLKNDEWPAFCYRESTDGKRLQTSLIEAVRRVMNIPNVNATTVVPLKTERVQKPGTAKGKKGKLDQLPAGVVFGPVETRPVDWYFDSPHQERDEPSDEWLDELGDSLLQVQLEPLVALPTGELISGHTRLRAAKRKGIATLQVRIVDCDEVTAQRLVLLFNAKRQDLTDRERCRHYVALLERYLRDGLTHGQLAEDLSLDSSTLSNELRMAAVPDELWKRREAGGLKAHQLRRLSTHAGREAFVAGFVGQLKTLGIAEDVQPEPNHFEQAFTKGIERAYRTMTKDEFGNGCQFKPTAAQKKELDLVEVERFGGKELMAANVSLWNQLNGAAIAKTRSSTTTTTTTADAVLSIAASAVGESETDKSRKAMELQKRQQAIEDSWDIAYVAAINHRFTGKLKRTDSMTLARLAALVQREGSSNDSRLTIIDITADDADFITSCQGVVLNFFDVNNGAGCWMNLTSEELRAVAKWLEVSPVEFWKATHTVLSQCTDDEIGKLLKEAQLLPGDREANLEQLIESWKPGWVPKGFTLKKGK